VEVPGQTLEAWELNGAGFSIVAEKRGISGRFDEETLVGTCRDMVIPMLAAMAELYGYDPVEEPEELQAEALLEGAVRVSLVKRRERNPRNRLLCLRIHGTSCKVCGLNPEAVYGDAGSIIEVHHIQPLSSGEGARPYDPATDLIPLCPNCHRAAHTRRPLPLSPGELRKQLGHHG
jgi:5-methylcytosine-specific restriction protein A